MSVFGVILLCIFPLSVQMRRNTDQNNSEYEHFLHSVCHKCQGADITKPLIDILLAKGIQASVNVFLGYFYICEALKYIFPNHICSALETLPTDRIFFCHNTVLKFINLQFFLKRSVL